MSLKSVKPSNLSVLKMQARKRFHSGMSDSQNAIESGVSRQTIAAWKKKYKWEEDKLEIEERARELYVETSTQSLVSQTDEIDTDHKEILANLRATLKKAAANDASVTAKDLNDMGTKLLLAEKLIKLEREVLGLTNRANIPKMTFPTGFAIKLRTGQKDVALEPEISEDELFNALPNQNEEFFGSEAEMQEYVEQADDGDDYDYDEIQSIPSLSL